MPNPLQIAGSGVGVKYAPITTLRLFTGLWTQRSPLRDAATSYLFERFYGAGRFDSLIDGLNVELTSKLTLARRPGLSIYNNQSFAAPDSFYEFHQFSANTTTIRVMVDTATTIYDGTGPSTQTNIFTKSAGAGQAFFQGVGNTLYIGDGVDQIKWLQSSISWAATTAFTTGQYIVDTNNNLQQVTTPGTSGGSQPAWNVTIRGTTTDGGITWTNRGSSVNKWQLPAPPSAPSISIAGAHFWKASTSYTSNIPIKDKNGNIQFQVGGGVSGTTYPPFSPQFGTITPDGTANWQNAGVPAAWKPSTVFAFDSCIVDINGNLQLVTAFVNPGQSGTTQPTWATTFGSTTTDNNLTWTCLGTGNTVVVSNYQYCFCFHMVDGSFSTASPVVNTGPVLATSYSASITGTGIADGQCDFISVFRTADGGNTMLFDGQVANPGASGWTFTDTTPDANLIVSQQAPINHANDPPPAGFINLAYHLSRVFGSVGNTVFYSQAPLVSVGVGTEQFPPASSFVFPSYVMRLLPTAVGLLVFTQSDIYVIGGQGTSSSPLYSIPYLLGYGLNSYNCLDVNGSTIYMFTTQKLLISLDPSAGVSEIGFPIGDLLNSFSTTNSYVAWYVGGSGDSALYIGDGSTGWFRMNPTPAPESGLTWSPKAVAQNTELVKCIQQVETSPGVHKLLMGVGSGIGPILQRDLTTNQDTNTPFPAFATIGSIVLALPSQLAELLFFETDSVAVGTRPAISVLMGEISGSFESLAIKNPDPPLLIPSTSLYSDRYWFSTGIDPAWCRHFQVKITWPAENFKNELLSYTLCGAHHSTQ